jgi:hypothetical protein
MHRKNREREENLKLECGWCAHCRGVNIVILNWQRPLWEGDQEVVKRQGRNEPMWVAIHTCMEAMLGNSLYSCLYLKLPKCYVFLIISYVLSSTKQQEGGTGSAWKRQVAGVGKWPKQCIHMWVNVKMIKEKGKNGMIILIPLCSCEEQLWLCWWMHCTNRKASNRRGEKSRKGSALLHL